MTIIPGGLPSSARKIEEFRHYLLEEDDVETFFPVDDDHHFSSDEFTTEAFFKNLASPKATTPCVPVWGSDSESEWSSDQQSNRSAESDNVSSTDDDEAAAAWIQSAFNASACEPAEVIPPTPVAKSPPSTSAA
jgi:hypothetical protein